MWEDKREIVCQKPNFPAEDGWRCGGEVAAGYCSGVTLLDGHHVWGPWVTAIEKCTLTWKRRRHSVTCVCVCVCAYPQSTREELAQPHVTFKDYIHTWPAPTTSYGIELHHLHWTSFQARKYFLCTQTSPLHNRLNLPAGHVAIANIYLTPLTRYILVQWMKKKKSHRPRNNRKMIDYLT